MTLTTTCHHSGTVTYRTRGKWVDRAVRVPDVVLAATPREEAERLIRATGQLRPAWFGPLMRLAGQQVRA